MELRPYQIPIFKDNTTGILGLHWARQLGKSTVLAAWAFDRLLTRPGRLVTVLGNCQQNGAEFAEKCQDICAEHGATSFVLREIAGNRIMGIMGGMGSGVRS